MMIGQHNHVSDEKTLDILLEMTNKVASLEERLKQVEDDLAELKEQVATTGKVAQDAKDMSANITAERKHSRNLNSVMITSFVLPVLVYIVSELWDNIRPLIIHFLHTLH